MQSLMIVSMKTKTGPFLAHMYRVIIHLSKPLKNDTVYELGAQIDGRQRVISSRAGTLKLRSEAFTVYPQVDGKPDIHVKPDAKDSVYNDLVKMDTGPTGLDERKLPFRVNQISFKNHKVNACNIRGIYVQYMSSSSYSTRLKYSSFVNYQRKSCKESGNLKVV